LTHAIALTIDKLKDRVRQLSQRTRGHKVERIVEELRTSLLRWRAYFGITEVRRSRIAMPARYFKNLGLPSLAEAST
jgi:hypothetical protein